MTTESSLSRPSRETSELELIKRQSVDFVICAVAVRFAAGGCVISYGSLVALEISVRWLSAFSNNYVKANACGHFRSFPASESIQHAYRGTK